MVKGVEKGYILEIENFVKFNVHSPLNMIYLLVIMITRVMVSQLSQAKNL